MPAHPSMFPSSPPHSPNGETRSGLRLHMTQTLSPCRPAPHHLTSTTLAETQQAIKGSLSGHVVFRDENIADRLILHTACALDNLVTVIFDSIMKPGSDLKAAYDVLVANETSELLMYSPLLLLLRHITEFVLPTYSDENPPPGGDPSNMIKPIERICEPSHYHTHPPPESVADFGSRILRTWVDTHRSVLKTDPGLYIAVKAVDQFEGGRKRRRVGDGEGPRKRITKVPFPLLGHQRQNTSNSGVQQGETSIRPHLQPQGDAEETSDAILDDRKPDITLIDLPTTGDVPSEVLWRQCLVFLEVKKDSGEGPNPAGLGDTRIKSILTQMADNARLQLAARPFMRFCIHLSLCGTVFNIVLFDRAGAVVSRDYSLVDDFKLIILIIRHLATGMTAYDLGLDSTVRPLQNLGDAFPVPEYLVKVSENTWFRTAGVPMWQSLSLLGRGTHVFQAQEYGRPDAPLLILKSSWRKIGRFPEAELYKILSQPSPLAPLDGIADFVTGQDVKRSKDDAEPISAATHRNGFGKLPKADHNVVLHRLILATKGKSMTAYVVFDELLLAGKGVLRGIRSLQLRGVNHRDISIGNVFIAEDLESGGFLADLDLSSIFDFAFVEKHYPELVEKLKDTQTNEHRTGTALFIALAILKALTVRDRLTAAGRQVSNNLSMVFELRHDLESLLWVVIYAIMIHHYNGLTDVHQRKAYRAQIEQCFGSSSYSVLRVQHTWMVSLNPDEDRMELELLFPDKRERLFVQDVLTLLWEQEGASRRKLDLPLDDPFQPGEDESPNEIDNAEDNGESDDSECSEESDSSEDPTYVEESAPATLRKVVKDVITLEAVEALFNKHLATKRKSKGNSNAKGKKKATSKKRL